MNSPVFSFISQRTENRAGFIRWQFNVCFLKIEIKILLEKMSYDIQAKFLHSIWSNLTADEDNSKILYWY